MQTGRSRLSWNIAKQSFSFRTVILACLVAILLYVVINSAGALLSHPKMVWPLWPGCALLVSVLLLVPKKTWPSIIPAAFAAFVLCDLQAGVPISSVAWFVLADLFQVLIAAFSVSYFFDGIPRLNSVRALNKYIFSAIILAPDLAAFLSAFGIPGDYWTSWRISFFSDVLAFLTLTPTILGWVNDGAAWVRKPRAYHVEFSALIASLAVLGYFTFTASGSDSPALLYSLVPFLLWAALRFGSLGVSTSACLIAFLSIWAAIHGRGPFTNGGLFDGVFWLQLFLIFTVIPFMVLAALVEERKDAQRALQKREAELNEAQRLAQVGSWQWDPNTDSATWSEQLYRIGGRAPDTAAFNYKEQPRLYTPESWERLQRAVQESLRSGTPFELDLELLRPDGTTRWIIARGEVQRDAAGRVTLLRGTGQDITERRLAQEELRESEKRFRLAAQAGKMFATAWDATTDEITRSSESSQILGIDEAIPTTGQQMLAMAHPEDRQKLTDAIAKLSPEKSYLAISYRMTRPNGTVIWLERSGQAHFDEHGRMLRIVGMVADITERKQTEEALQESEERLRLAVQAGRMYVFERDAVTDAIVRSGRCADILDWMNDPTSDTGRQFVARVHSADREAYAATEAGLTPENPSYQTSYRMISPDGNVIWLEESGRGFFDGTGQLLRMIGLVADVTERKLAEEAVSSLSRRLIVAQEQERARIARDLHDDLGQRMALLQVGIQQFEHSVTRLSSRARQQLRDLAETSAEVSTGIHDLSHQLHPSRLDILGLIPSLRGLCREFSPRHKLRIAFVPHDIQQEIPKDVSLCLYRIAEEALQNIVKHSRAEDAKVELSADENRIELCISDSGRGFSPESAREEAGLGLISMRERLRLVRGILSVESEPSHGTQIRVRIPLDRTAGQTANGQSQYEATA
ncbi:MAG: PAS domain-containing protein [Candidatus Sulfotelmatobacter sp.]